MLVDTSVWVDHLRRRNLVLARLLDRGEVWCHPFVIGEVACGRLVHRAEVLSLLGALPRTPEATHDEVMAFVESNDLGGAGIGWIDANLLASARLTGLPLWTLDRKPAEAARSTGTAAKPRGRRGGS
jgi:predicted nucleic acid-binding protein